MNRIHFVCIAMPLLGAALLASPGAAVAVPGMPGSGQHKGVSDIGQGAQESPYSASEVGQPRLPGCPPAVRRVPPDVLCIQVITYARNPGTGQCCEYPNPCSAPPAWETFGNLEECRAAQ